MNLAFVTLLIIFILLPGIIFRRSYLSSRYSIKYTKRSIFDDIFYTLIPGIILHMLWIGMIRIWDFDINLVDIGYLITGVTDTDIVKNTFTHLHSNLFWIFSYNISLFLFAWFLGYTFRLLVRGVGLDIRIRILRFSNRWIYLFEGEYLDILYFEYKHNKDKPITTKLKDCLSKIARIIKSPGRIESYVSNIKKHSRKIGFIYADVLTEIAGQSILYSGQVEDFYMAENGGLDRIILKTAYRRNLKNDHPAKYSSNNEDQTTEAEDNVPDSIAEKHRWYKIQSKFLIIPYERITNLNIRYRTLDVVEN